MFWEERNRDLYPCPWNVMEESQGETAQAYFPEQVREYHPNQGKDKSLHERMAELLWDSGHEEKHRKPEWMVVPPDTDVYLETVETAQNQNEETHRTGSRQPLCGNNSLRPQGILVQCRKQGGQLGIK